MKHVFKFLIVAIIMIIVGIIMMWGLTLMAVPDVANEADASLYFPDEYGGSKDVKLGDHKYEVWVGSEEMLIPPEVAITDSDDNVVWRGEESDQQLRNTNMFGKFDCPGGNYTVHTSRFTEVHFVEGEVQSWDPAGTVCAGGIIGLIGGIMLMIVITMLVLESLRSPKRAPQYQQPPPGYPPQQPPPGYPPQQPPPGYPPQQPPPGYPPQQPPPGYPPQQRPPG